MKFKNSLIAYSSQGISAVCGMAFVLFVTKYYGINEYGILVLVLSVVGVVSNALGGRTAEATTYFYSRELKKSRSQVAFSYALIGVLIDVVLAVLVLTIVYFASELVAIKLLGGIDYLSLYFLISISIVLTGLTSSINGYIQAKNKFLVLYSLSCGIPVLRLIIILVLYFVVSNNSIDEVAYAYIMASLIMLVISGICFLICARSEKFIRISKDQLYEYISFCKKTLASMTIKSVNENVEILALGYFTTPDKAGVYNLIKKLVSHIQFVAAPYSVMYYRKFVELYSDKQIDKLYAAIIKESSFIVVIGLCIIVLLAAILESVFSFANVQFQTIYYTYLLILGFKFIVIGGFWWCRIFSNTVNPNFSIINAAMIFSVKSILLVLFYFTYKVDILTVVIVEALSYLVPAYYFSKKLFDLKRSI